MQGARQLLEICEIFLKSAEISSEVCWDRAEHCCPHTSDQRQHCGAARLCPQAAAAACCTLPYQLVLLNIQLRQVSSLEKKSTKIVYLKSLIFLIFVICAVHRLYKRKTKGESFTEV